jgi:hypothetical protein
MFAPVRVLSGGSAPGDDAGPPDPGDLAEDILGELLGSPSGAGGDVVAAPAGLAPLTGGGPGSPTSEGLHRLVDESDPDSAISFVADGTGGTGTAEFATLGVSAAGTLPLTGLSLATVAVLGLWLFASGLALRLVPGGRRR